jgi:hypothetical protein
MKVKISEALLAGCPVITTTLGADGFSPKIRDALHVVDHLSEVTRDMCLTANSVGVVAENKLYDLTLEGASALYAKLLADALSQ